MTDLDVLAQRALTAQRVCDQEAGQLRAIAERGQRLQADIATLHEQVELHQKVNALLTSVGEERQLHAQRQVEELSTRGLQVVFSENLSFHVIQAVRGNRAEVEFVIRTTVGDTQIDTPVLEARGGGMAAVVGFMLRLVVLLLTPGASRLLVLDETFAHVSAEYETRVAEFLREVSAKAGVQIILDTHSTAYDDVADSRYRIEPQANGLSKVVKL